MTMNFAHAHDFSINGGNFGTINGGVNNYNLAAGSLASPTPLGLGSIATGALPLPPSQGHNASGAAIHSVPSTPATTHTNNTPSPTSTASTTGSGSGYDLSSRMSSASPASTGSDVEEQRHYAASPYRPQPTQQPELNLLTPLTDTLGLRRFTPASQAATLSPYQTPQQDTTEFPGSPQYTGQAPTPLLLPRHSRTPQLDTQVPTLPSTPRPVHSPQFLGHDSPPTPLHSADFPVFRTSSTSPNGLNAGPRAAHSSPIPPYPQNSPPPFDSSSMSPRAATVPHNTADSDDPSVIFQRLRAETKGYANPLSHSNVYEYSSPPSQSGRTSLPRQAEVPQVDQAPELAAPQSSHHWTPGVISDWTNHVHQGGPSTMPVHDNRNESALQHRGSRPLPSPPVSQYPANSFSLSHQQQQYPLHADVYHPGGFHQPQYQDQPWSVFAPVMHPPHSFPPQHYNRLSYNQPQSAYHATTNYSNVPNFPMPLMG